MFKTRIKIKADIKLIYPKVSKLHIWIISLNTYICKCKNDYYT